MVIKELHERDIRMDYKYSDGFIEKSTENKGGWRRRSGVIMNVCGSTAEGITCSLEV